MALPGSTELSASRALAEACQLGAYRRAHRTSDEQCHVRAQLAARDALVRNHTRYVSPCRDLLRLDGWRVRTGLIESFHERLAELYLPDELVVELQPPLLMITNLSEQVRLLDQKLDSTERDWAKAHRSSKLVESRNLNDHEPDGDSSTGARLVTTLGRGAGALTPLLQSCESRGNS
jgi:hypothetical protein